VKIHRRTGKLSYLVYPDFDKDPHPALHRYVKLNLRTRQLECYGYATSANPPVLHRKETFLAADDERREKFARVTADEEKNGLLGGYGWHRHPRRVAEAVERAGVRPPGSPPGAREGRPSDRDLGRAGQPVITGQLPPPGRGHRTAHPGRRDPGPASRPAPVARGSYSVSGTSRTGGREK
jgi:hypothetical protein